jgi:hypothetical protein
MRSRFSKKKSVEVTEESNSIEFEVNKEKYKLSITNDSNKLHFKLKDESSSIEYILEKTFEDLKQMNRYFLFFSVPTDLITNLLKQVKKNNLTVSKDSNSCNLVIINPITDEEIFLKMECTQSQSQSETTQNTETNQNLSSSEISDLQKRVNDLEKRMKELESKIGECKNTGGITSIDDIGDGEKVFNSNIINQKEENIIKSWFNTKIQNAELIFDTKTDGDSIGDFKKKCFGQFPTLLIIRTDMGFMFGGYATTAWKENGPITDYNSFVFSFNPDKKYNVIMPRFALFGCNEKEKVLFQFGSVCFRIEDNCTKSGNNVIRGSGYERGLIDLIKGDHKFRVSRLEVFKLSF